MSGVGVVSPIGIGGKAFWNSLMEGRSGVDFLRAVSSQNLPTHFSAEVLDFDPLVHLPQKKFLKVMSRAIQLGVVAGTLAMNDAGLANGDVDPERLGVVFGAGRLSSTPEELADSVRNFAENRMPFDASLWNADDMERIAPLWLLRQLPNSPACHISMEFDARGPNNTITCRDASTLLALMEAVNTIERDAADCMIVGGSGSNVPPVDLAKFCLFEEMSAKTTEPSQAVRPFDMQRDGMVAGEGAAAFVVERRSHALRRGATIYGEIVAIAAGADGKGHASRSNGTGLANAVKAALKQARMTPNQVGHINADGKSTRRDDVIEARAYHHALGEWAERVPVVALKSYFGFSEAGSSALELAGSLLALKHGRIPRTLNYQFPDPQCSLNVIHGDVLKSTMPTAVCVNRTSLGQSAAVVLRGL